MHRGVTFGLYRGTVLALLTACAWLLASIERDARTMEVILFAELKTQTMSLQANRQNPGSQPIILPPSIPSVPSTP